MFGEEKLLEYYTEENQKVEPWWTDHQLANFPKCLLYSTVEQNKFMIIKHFNEQCLQPNKVRVVHETIMLLHSFENRFMLIAEA